MISADSIAVRDTLQSKINNDYQQQAADSVSLKHVVEYVLLDSTNVTFPIYIPTFDKVSTQTLFGNEVLIVSHTPAPRHIAEKGQYNEYFDFGYQLILLMLFVLYNIVLFRFGSVSKKLFKAIWRTSYIDKFITEKSVNVQILLVFTSIIGAMGAMIAACNLPQITGVQIPKILGIEGRIMLPIMTAIALVALTIYKRILCRIIGALSADKYFTEDFRMMRRVFNAICSMLLIPLIFIGAFMSEKISLVIYVIAAICLIISSLTYLIKMKKIFVIKKVSSLQWFLYLCTVEVLPLSFLLLLLFRGA